MKILTALIRRKGGVGNSNNELSKELRKKGYQVDVLSREDDLKIFTFKGSIFPIRKEIRKLMKKNNYDIIYTQDYSLALTLLFPYPLFWKKHFCCFCGIKTWGTQKVVQTVTGKIMGEKLIVVGNQLKERFPKSTLIQRGVNFKKFKPLGKRRNYIGWVDRDIETISKKELQKIADLNGLKLLIAKGIPPNKMNEFYNKCKVFISLPTKAGANNVWGEAMSAGVPIVIGNNKGPGPIFPFDKILENESKIEKMTKIIKNPKRINYRKWLIDNGFFWKNKAEKLISFFGRGKARERGYCDKCIQLNTKMCNYCSGFLK